MNCCKCHKPLVSAQGGSLLVCLEHGVMSKGPNADRNVNAYGRRGTENPEKSISGSTPTDTASKPQTRSPANVERLEATQSAGEALFAEEWEARYPDTPFVREYMFCLVRNWRLDFSWPNVRVAVEVESAVHRTKGRFATDLPKYNALSFDGWILFRCTRAMLESDAERFCRMVMETITKRLRG